MRSFILLPNDVKDTDQLVIPNLYLLHDWKSYDALLKIVKNFQGCSTFTVWEHQPQIKAPEGIHLNQSPAILADCTCVGSLTSAMGVLRFIPGPLCKDAVREQLHKAGVKIMEQQDTSADLLIGFQTRLIAAVNKTLLEFSSKASMVNVAESMTHCSLKFDDKATMQSSCLLFDDGSNRTVWQRLGELGLSPNMNVANIYYVKRQPNGMGLILHCLQLTYNQQKKQEIYQLQLPHSDQTVSTQNKQYLESMIIDLFACQDNESSAQCQSRVANACHIDYESMSFDFSPNFIKICHNILWVFITGTPFQQSYAHSFEMNLTRHWEQRLSVMMLESERRKRELEDAAAAKLMQAAINEEAAQITQTEPEFMDDRSNDDEELARAIQLSYVNDNGQADNDDAALAIAMQASVQGNNNREPDDNIELQQAVRQSRITTVKALCCDLLSELYQCTWTAKQLGSGKRGGVRDMADHLKKIAGSDQDISEAEVLATLQRFATSHSQNKGHRFGIYSKTNDARQSFYAMVIGADSLSTLLVTLMSSRTEPLAERKNKQKQ